MTNLTRRIERLEGTAGTHQAPTCIVVTDYPEEPTDVAVARYRADHPDTCRAQKRRQAPFSLASRSEPLIPFYGSTNRPSQHQTILAHKQNGLFHSL